MAIISYKGNEYFEPERETQIALKAVDVYTFRYYPKRELIIMSDIMVETFFCRKYYDVLPETIIEDFVLPDDAKLLSDINERLMAGEERVSQALHTKDGAELKVTLSAIEWDEQHICKAAIGLIESSEGTSRIGNLIQALSDNYESVYYVDFDANEIIPYRLSSAIEGEYGAYFRTKPPYDHAIKSYISRTVAPEDRDEMLRISSYEYLNKQLSQNPMFVQDYLAMRNGKTLYCRMKAVNMSEGDHLTKMVMGFADVSIEKQKDLEKYAYTDPVTSGPNYIWFKLRLKETKGLKGYMISMDIHSFRVVNSVCGIHRGDETLRAVWQCISDQLGECDLAGHINADHFVIFLNGSEERAVEYVTKLNARLKDISMAMDLPQLRPYFGLAPWDGDNDETIEMIYGQANTAKHEIKQKKDIFYAFYHQVDTKRLIEEKRMEDSFNKAIEEHMFEVWYQPKYNPNDSALVGAEALVRWRRPDGSLVAPGVFIPLFEGNGMIRLLDEYVFRTVCRNQKRWEKEGGRLVPISINLSRASLYFQNVVEQYTMIADETGVTPYLVPIEITESAAVANEDIKGLSEKFYTSGFPLHMDDFGSGYSSLATLNMLHFDTLKLDKSLIDFIGNYGGERLLVHTIALAKELGLHVTAEGVERKEQVEFLQDLNCDSIQGFYYARPMPQADFEELILQDRKW